MKNFLAVVLCLTLAAACGSSGSTTRTVSPAPPTSSSFRVEGHGMSPTLTDGEVVTVVPYDGRSPKRGDIVVFLSPQRPDLEFVKRLIGLPGETIGIDEATSTVSIDGEVLSEPYVQGPTQCTQTCVWTLPPEGSQQAREQCGSDRCHFVLGDNRQNSSDSRQGWLVPAENIRGFVEVD